MQNEDIRVVVAQEQCLLRGAMIDRLLEEPLIRACAAAPEMSDIKELIRKIKPHVLVINISLGSNIGLSSLRNLRKNYPKLAIVALSCKSEFENIHVTQVFRVGANGFVSSKDSLETLVRAIHAVLEGKRCLSALSETLYQPSAEEEKVLRALSQREAEVYCLRGSGYISKRIAEKMGITPKTVDTYLERIRKKLNLSGFADFQYSATSFMLSAARRGWKGKYERVIRELIATTS